LRQARGANFRLVTPGIRLAGDSPDDQRRVVTPGDAVAKGSDYLVIGRSVTAAADPLAALERVHAELAGTA
jgi:orotidine-5'-phosphate decarboxylase